MIRSNYKKNKNNLDNQTKKKYPTEKPIGANNAAKRFFDKDPNSATKESAEFGGSIGALFLIISVPIGVIALFIICDEQQCSFLQLPNFSKYASTSTYFNSVAIIGWYSFLAAAAILFSLPFGGEKVIGMPTKQGKLIYIMNGPLASFILIAIAIAIEYLGISLSDFATKHIMQLLTAAIFAGFFLTTYAFIRSFFVPIEALNVDVIGKNPISSYFLGRELNPRIFGVLDIKMYAIRVTLIGAILFDILYLYKNFNSSNGGFNPTLSTLVLIHSIYYLDGLIAEKCWVTSFEIQHESFGYISAMGYMIFPFMSVASTKYVFEHSINLEFWKLVLITLVFLVGIILYRGSNYQKDAFRKNPNDPALSHLQTISTSRGTKLIVSGVWGIVRHPNYLGDILINLSFAAFVWNVPPVIVNCVDIVFLFHRTLRDNARCQQKYGSDWKKYCNKVKYVLIPKIY